MGKPNVVYYVFYYLACIFSLGIVWFVRSLISHAVYEGQLKNN
jgi:hypothetical protein